MPNGQVRPALVVAAHGDDLAELEVFYSINEPANIDGVSGTAGRLRLRRVRQSKTPTRKHWHWPRIEQNGPTVGELAAQVEQLKAELARVMTELTGAS